MLWSMERAETNPTAAEAIAGRCPRFPGPRSAAMIEELGRYVIADLQPFVVDVER